MCSSFLLLFFFFLPSIFKTDATPFLIAPSGPSLLTEVMHSPHLDVLSCWNPGFWWVTWDRACFVLAGVLFLQLLPAFPLPAALAFLRIDKGRGWRVGCCPGVVPLVPPSTTSRLRSCITFKSSPPGLLPRKADMRCRLRSQVWIWDGSHGAASPQLRDKASSGCGA